MLMDYIPEPTKKPATDKLFRDNGKYLHKRKSRQKVPKLGEMSVNGNQSNDEKH